MINMLICRSPNFNILVKFYLLNSQKQQMANNEVLVVLPIVDLKRRMKGSEIHPV